MKVPVSELNTAKIKSILDAWVVVGGNNPEMEADEIARDIKKVLEGDSIARFSLDDGYRFGSKVGSSKLFLRIRGDQVDIGMHPNNPYAREERIKEAERVSGEFEKKLKEIFSA